MICNWYKKVAVLLCSWFVCGLYADELYLSHVQTFYGEVGASNFTYYKLTLKGNVLVHLHSYEGDADLYLSTETIKPLWHDYTMKSDTCGDDAVQVNDYDERPVGIGVYGYIQHPLSKYKLSVFVDESRSGLFPDDIVSNTEHFDSSVTTENSMHDGQEEESLLWRIFVWFVKVTLEVLL